MSRELAKLWYETGWKVMELGAPLDAARFFGESLSSIRLVHEKKNHINVAFVLQGLSSALLQVGNLVEAKKCFAESLDMFGKSSEWILYYQADVFRDSMFKHLYRFVNLHQQMIGCDLTLLGFAVPWSGWRMVRQCLSGTNFIGKSSG